MIIYLTEDNRLQLTEKALLINDFRTLYNYYTGKLNNQERAMAAFGVLYYMYYFDSKFLLEYPDDEDARFKEVKKFVYKGEDITRIKIFDKAAETYQSLMSKEQTDLYVTMKKNVLKLKDYAQRMVLVRPTVTEEDIENLDKENKATDNSVHVKLTDFLTTNNSLPDQEEKLEKFKERLEHHFKNNIDIYGGGERGAYE